MRRHALTEAMLRLRLQKTLRVGSRLDAHTSKLQPGRSREGGGGGGGIKDTRTCNGNISASIALKLSGMTMPGSNSFVVDFIGKLVDEKEGLKLCMQSDQLLILQHQDPG